MLLQVHNLVEAASTRGVALSSSCQEVIDTSWCAVLAAANKKPSVGIIYYNINDAGLPPGVLIDSRHLQNLGVPDCYHAAKSCRSGQDAALEAVCTSHGMQ